MLCNLKLDSWILEVSLVPSRTLLASIMASMGWLLWAGFYGLASMRFCGLLWASVSFCGLPWASMGFYGLLWASMGFYGLLWTEGQRDGQMVGRREGRRDRWNSVRLEESKNGRV